MASDTHRTAQGVHGVGSAEYSQDQYVRVVAAFLGQAGPVTALELHRLTGVPGLTVRQIMSAADGVDFLLGGSGADGYRRASSPEDAARLTARFRSQIGRMAARAERRQAFVERMAEGA